MNRIAALASILAIASTTHGQLISTWSAPLFDDGAPSSDPTTSWLTDTATGQFSDLPNIFGARNLAADNSRGRLYSAGVTFLLTYDALDPSDPAALAEVLPRVRILTEQGDAIGTTSALGFARGQLYAFASTGFYAINPDTGVATPLPSPVEGRIFSGIDYNPADGMMYAIEGSFPNEQIVAFDLDTFTIQPIAVIPESVYNFRALGSYSFDGVAVGDNKVFLTTSLTDQFGSLRIAVYDLATGAFSTLQNPSRRAENRSYAGGATFFAPRGASERDVQIRSVDFDAGVIELFNFSSIDFDLSGWRFCSHDFDQARRYTAAAGFDGVTIESNTSVFVHFNNDAPANDADRINRSMLGGAFALPLDQDAYALQLFNPDSNGNISFGNSSLIADHVQWNVNGSGVGSAEARTAQAVSEQLWSASGDFVATQADSDAVVLTDLSGDIEGAPTEYAVLRNNTVHNETVDGDLSDDPNAPSALAFDLGSNVVEGQVNLSNDTTNGDRDFITLSVPAGQVLTGLTLLDWDPDNIGFIAVNAGSTGFVPSGATDAQFLAGVLVDTSNQGDNLLANLVSQSVTQNSLSKPELPEGDYTFVIQQTSNLVQDYALDFVVTESDEPCLADVNGDGSLTPADFSAWIIAFNTQAAECDQNGDGLCTPSDFTAWVLNFNAGC
ncbi:MAG: GC-type dockerin domain-anchored protein [Planctomycetota bacterium]